MTDLRDRLELLAEDLTRDVALGASPATARDRRPRRAVSAAAATLVAAIVALAVIVAVRHDARVTVVTTTPTTTGGPHATPTGRPHARSSTVTRDGITVRVLLSRTRVPVGRDVTGQLTVDNRTKRAIAPPGGMLCASLVFKVLLYNRSQPAEGGFIQPACTPGFVFKPGITTEPIRTETTFYAKGATRTLPAGAYSVKVYWDKLPLPVPPNLHVTIVDGPSVGPPAVATLQAIAPRVIRAADRTDVTLRLPPRGPKPKISEKAAARTAERYSNTRRYPIAADLEELTNTQFPRGRLVWAVQSELPDGFFPPSIGPALQPGTKRSVGPTLYENARLDFVDAATGRWLEGLTFHAPSH